MNQKVLDNPNYTYDADGERIVRYVPGRLDAFYSANQAGHNDRLESFIYPSGLLTVKTLPEESQRKKQIATYTKHYYIGAERISSVIGRGNGIGQNLLEPCDSSFPSTQDIFMMNNEKVQEAEDALQDDYQFFEKQLVMSESFSNRPGCFAMSYTGEHNTYWFHPDHLGSSSYISNKNKEISQHLEYFPFGETLVEEHKNSNNSPYKFNGKELDDETGNYYYGARYYNPKFSIWLSVDPLAEKYPGWSPYAYTMQNPLRYTDPTGMSADDIFQIDQKGKITQIEAEGEDVLAVVDKKGNEISDRVNIGSDAELREFGEIQVLEISNQDKAKSAFKAAADNTKREFGLINKEDTGTGNKSSAIVGDGAKGNNSADIIAKGLYDGIGNTVVNEITHNHPKNSPPSGYYVNTKDNINPKSPIGDAKNATTYPSNANDEPITRRVYTPKNGKSYRYDKNKVYKPENY